jgi:hypothetical protein
MHYTDSVAIHLALTSVSVPRTAVKVNPEGVAPVHMHGQAALFPVGHLKCRLITVHSSAHGSEYVPMIRPMTRGRL